MTKKIRIPIIFSARGLQEPCDDLVSLILEAELYKRKSQEWLNSVSVEKILFFFVDRTVVLDPEETIFSKKITLSVHTDKRKDTVEIIGVCKMGKRNNIVRFFPKVSEDDLRNQLEEAFRQRLAIGTVLVSIAKALDGD